ncbi:MAG: hypothetical protein CMB42_00125 [Euryarchaeota archaeon]|nr:hypothetical protein [Euryarchaeota archaeon]|tara:strand:- start:31375 stop:32196 length:822 start_codon:yes stop_codon:yes gene_type:complete
MGLLEKAESGKEPGDEEKKKAVQKPQSKKVSPEPKKQDKPKKESRFSRRRATKEKKGKPQKTVEDLPSFPTGFEQPTSGQLAFRRMVDVLVCYGWMFPVVGIFAWGTDFDATYFIIGGMLLYIGNVGFLPSRFNRTVGNIVSRTKFVTSAGNNASWAYTFLKGLNFPFALIGVVTALTILSDLSSPLGDSTGSAVFRVIGLLLLIPLTLDWMLSKFSMAKRGLWERIFGGVWLVRSTKTGSSKGWLKRLDQLSDYAEKRGLLSEKEEDNPNLE